MNLIESKSYPIMGDVLNLQYNPYIPDSYKDKFKIAIQYILNNGLDLNCNVVRGGGKVYISIEMYDSTKEHKIGYFLIDEFGNGKLNSMHIEVDEDAATYAGIGHPRGSNLARFMVITTLVLIQKEIVRVDPHMICHIDVDASDGFWRHIGMRTFGKYRDTNEEEFIPSVGKYKPIEGYERAIELQNILFWALGTRDMSVLYTPPHIPIEIVHQTRSITGHLPAPFKRETSNSSTKSKKGKRKSNKSKSNSK